MISTAIIGFLSGVLGGIGVWYFSVFYPRLLATFSVQLTSQNKHEAFFPLRVTNNGIFPIKNAIIYITIDHFPDDILDLSSFAGNLHVFIRQESNITVIDDRIHWACQNTSGIVNPMVMDIYSGESQAFNLAADVELNFYRDKNSMIVKSYDMLRTLIIGCEAPFPDIKDGSHSGNTPACVRTILQPKEYKGVISLVSESTFRCSWEFTINPNETINPISIGKKRVNSKAYNYYYA